EPFVQEDRNTRGEIITKKDERLNFTPVDQSFVSIDDADTTEAEVVVIEGKKFKGTVHFESGSPVEDATVYLDDGKGVNTDIKTKTNNAGAFILSGIPRLEFSGEYVLKAVYSDDEHTYVADTKKVSIHHDEDESIDFEIQAIEDIDATHLLGMPIEITDKTNLDNGNILLSGAFRDIPHNENFAIDVASLGSALQFERIEVEKSDLQNEEGVPYAVPKEDHILLETKEFPE